MIRIKNLNRGLKSDSNQISKCTNKCFRLECENEKKISVPCLKTINWKCYKKSREWISWLMTPIYCTKHEAIHWLKSDIGCPYSMLHKKWRALYFVADEFPPCKCDYPKWPPPTRDETNAEASSVKSVTSCCGNSPTSQQPGVWINIERHWVGGRRYGNQRVKMKKQ